MTRPQVDPDADAPEWWRQTARYRRIPLIALIILVVLIYKATQGGSPPPITKSCTTPAFVLSTHTVGHARIVRWSATGPAGMHYLLTIGVSGFVSTQGKLVPTPDFGKTLAETQAVGNSRFMPGSCTDSGVFAAIVPAGSYTMRLFRFEGSGAQQEAVSTAEEPLTVTPTKG